MRQKYNYRFLFVLLTIVFLGCAKQEIKANTSVSSPLRNNQVDFVLLENGTPFYKVYHKGKTIIDTSTMGFEFKTQLALEKGFEIVGKKNSTHNETWDMPWGEQREVKNHFNEIVINLREKNESQRGLNIYFRAYDDGVAFRYEFPEQDGLEEIIILDENTQFNLTGDHTCWWIPGDWISMSISLTQQSFLKLTRFQKEIIITWLNHISPKTP